MSELDLGHLGIALSISADDSYLDDAAELEDLGYSTIWVPGGQLDNLDLLAKIIRATSAVRVAPGIIPVDVYRADAVAEFYADLETTDPGRLVVGLGGPQQPRPLHALNRYLDELDTADPPVPAGRRMIAALGPRKLELARDRSAGAVPLLVTPAYTADARRILGTDAVLAIDQMAVLDTDAARARETARGPLRFLSRVAGYAANFGRMGFSEADIADLSDRLVDELVVWGEADVIAARIAAQHEAGADHVVLTVLNDAGRPGAADVARALRELTASMPH